MPRGTRRLSGMFQESNSQQRSSSANLREHYAKHHASAAIKRGTLLGVGAEGVVYDAALLVPGKKAGSIETHACVVKEPKNHIIQPAELATHLLLTQNELSSEACGLLLILGIIENCVLLPKCEAILSSWLPEKINTLRDNHKNIFCHVVYNLFSSMVRGLQTLSKHDVIHGDIKPANIFFRNGYFGLLDFGAAKNRADVSSSARLDGTAGYFAPEVICRDSAGISNAADIFAVGQVLLQLLGEPMKFKHDVAHTMIFYAGEAYQTERAQHPYDASQNARFQIEMRDTLKKQIDFVSCLKWAATMMTDILPERRPNLETLKHIEAFLLRHLPTINRAELSPTYIRLCMPVISPQHVPFFGNRGGSTIFDATPMASSRFAAKAPEPLEAAKLVSVAAHDKPTSLFDSPNKESVLVSPGSFCGLSAPTTPASS